MRTVKKRASKPVSRKDPDRAVLTPFEVAEYTGFGQSAVYELLRSGEMPSIKTGSRWWIPRTALAAWLDSAGQRRSA